MNIEIKNKKIIKISITLFCLFVFLFNISKVQASNLSFSPSSGYYTVGDSIRIKVLVSSDISVNAVSAKISFPNNLLSLSSISKSESIVSLWAQDPSFSNIDGTANLEGVILNGYTGQTGGIVTLVFKAKAEGEATLNFTTGSVLANNGQGTETLTNRLNSVLHIAKGLTTLTPSKVVEKVEPKAEIPLKQEIVDVSKDVINKVTKIEQNNNLPDYSLVFVLILIIILLLVIIIICGIYYIVKLKNYLKKKLLNTENEVTKNFNLIENDVNEEISIANKIKKSEALNADEISFQATLQNDLKNTEETILKEIKNLEQE